MAKKFRSCYNNKEEEMSSTCIVAVVLLSAALGTTGSSSQLASTTDRVLQSPESATCKFTEHAKAIECTEPSVVGNDIRYLVSCPSDAATPDDCLTMDKPVCYQYNGVPCLQGSYCMTDNLLSLDCSNIFAGSLGDLCSATDCSGNCIKLVETPVPYTPEAQRSSCALLGYTTTCLSQDQNGACMVETSEWIDILEDSTRIHATITAQADGEILSCRFQTESGFICPCEGGCSGGALRYDCSSVSFDACAKTDCEGNCINMELLSTELPREELPEPPKPVPIIQWGPVVSSPAVLPSTLAPAPTTPSLVAQGSEKTETENFSVSNPWFGGFVPVPPGKSLPPFFFPTPQQQQVLQPFFAPVSFPPSPWAVKPPPQPLTLNNNPAEPIFQQASAGEPIFAQAGQELVPIINPPPPTTPGVVAFTVTNPEFLGPELFGVRPGGRALHDHSGSVVVPSLVSVVVSIVVHLWL